MHTDDRAERFSKAIRDRRTALGLTHAQVADLGGPSDSTMTKVENRPASVRGDVHRKLDVALGWAPGSSRRLWEDGTAPELEAGPPPRAGDLTDEELMAELGKRLRERDEVMGNAQHPAANIHAGNAREPERTVPQQPTSRAGVARTAKGKAAAQEPKVTRSHQA